MYTKNLLVAALVALRAAGALAQSDAAEPAATPVVEAPTAVASSVAPAITTSAAVVADSSTTSAAAATSTAADADAAASAAVDPTTSNVRLDGTVTDDTFDDDIFDDDGFERIAEGAYHDGEVIHRPLPSHREDGALEIWSQRNYHGYRAMFANQDYQCETIESFTFDHVGFGKSAKVVDPNTCCWLYSARGCNGHSFRVAGHVPSFRSYGMDNKVKSVMCRPCYADKVVN